MTTRRKNGSVKAIALELLCTVAYREDPTRPYGPDNVLPADGSKGGTTVGLSNKEVLKRLKERCPSASPSRACLIWYAARVREGREDFIGFVLPRRRPRS